MFLFTDHPFLQFSWKSFEYAVLYLVMDDVMMPCASCQWLYYFQYTFHL